MKANILVCLLSCCAGISISSFKSTDNDQAAWQSVTVQSKENTVGEIHLPAGFERIVVPKENFEEWLRTIHLRKSNIVYLYNGAPKERQNLHYAVLDVSTGNKDLQQCADAIMRLRAEYYFAKKEYNKIAFTRIDGKTLRFDIYALEHSTGYTHDCLLNFMEKVFIQCGTYTVDAMTKPVSLKIIQPGDVFVKPGSPGHAMIIIDVAEDKTTHQRIYLLAQSFMPAQDMHIVINPLDSNLSPWYTANGNETIVTPGWIFNITQLKRWK